MTPGHLRGVWLELIMHPFFLTSHAAGGLKKWCVSGNWYIISTLTDILEKKCRCILNVYCILVNAKLVQAPVDATLLYLWLVHMLLHHEITVHVTPRTDPCWVFIKQVWVLSEMHTCPVEPLPKPTFTVYASIICRQQLATFHHTYTFVTHCVQLTLHCKTKLTQPF